MDNLVASLKVRSLCKPQVSSMVSPCYCCVECHIMFCCSVSLYDFTILKNHSQLIEAEWSIYVGELTIIVSYNGLLPGWHQAIIWTNARILFIGTLGTNFSEIFIKIPRFSLKKRHLKMSSVKYCPFRFCLNVLMLYFTEAIILALTFMLERTRQIRTPVLRIPPAVTSQAKMKNWLHECQKCVSHMIGQYAHI